MRSRWRAGAIAGTWRCTTKSPPAVATRASVATCSCRRSKAAARRSPPRRDPRELGPHRGCADDRQFRRDHRAGAHGHPRTTSTCWPTPGQLARGTPTPRACAWRDRTRTWGPPMCRCPSPWAMAWRCRRDGMLLGGDTAAVPCRDGACHRARHQHPDLDGDQQRSLAEAHPDSALERTPRTSSTWPRCWPCPATWTMWRRSPSGRSRPTRCQSRSRRLPAR